MLSIVEILCEYPFIKSSYFPYDHTRISLESVYKHIFSMFKQFISLLLLIVLLVPINSYAFQDVEYSWYKDSITTLSNENIINGYSDGTFGPNNPITRAEILKILF